MDALDAIKDINRKYNGFKFGLGEDVEVVNSPLFGRVVARKEYLDLRCPLYLIEIRGKLDQLHECWLSERVLKS